MKLDRRSSEPELMDDADLGGEEYARCLRDLASVNRVTMTHRPTLAWLGRVISALPGDVSVRILDVACGHGDLLRAIGRWADRRGIAVALEGIDLNPRSAIEAAAATDPAMAITWRTGDVFEYAPDPKPDFIVSSQFAHHLGDDDVVRFVEWLDRHSARGWFIADLQRHSIAYYGFPLLAWAMFWHRIVRLDGTVSIARSFRRADWESILARAGIPAEIGWSLPFRWCVGRLK
jgi:2-polyprenyl-3-methyl-5-hydroxy-6-metoxy-1,4-benzoquinol methylase